MVSTIWYVVSLWHVVSLSLASRAAATVDDDDRTVLLSSLLCHISLW